MECLGVIAGERPTPVLVPVASLEEKEEARRALLMALDLPLVPLLTVVIMEGCQASKSSAAQMGFVVLGKTRQYAL
jgi:hypothetical protein